MGGEDFSFYAEKVPAVFIRIGCHKPETPILSTHNDHLVVDMDCFPIGIQVKVTTALKYLQKNKA